MTTYNILVVPRSSRAEVVGDMADGTLKIKLTAAPVDGEANEQLVALLAKHFAVPKSAVKIIRGQTGRRKVVRVDAP